MSLCRVSCASRISQCVLFLPMQSRCRCSSGLVAWSRDMAGKRSQALKIRAFQALRLVLVPRRLEQSDRQQPLVSHRTVGAALPRLRQCRITKPLSRGLCQFTVLQCRSPRNPLELAVLGLIFSVAPMQFLARYLQKLPGQTRAVAETCLYGLAAGAATVAFQLGMNWLYRLGLVHSRTSR